MKVKKVLKKSAALMLAVAMAVPMTTISAEAAVYIGATAPSVISQMTVPEAKVVEKGDVNNDGKISVRDALMALQFDAGIYAFSDEELAAAEVSGDEKVDAKDALLLLQTAVGKYGNFGYEKPTKDNVIFVDSATTMSNEYCYQSLGEALKYVHANTPKSEADRITILFAPGTYREQTKLRAPYVTYAAMNPEAEEPVNLTFYYGSAAKFESLNGTSPGTSGSASTVIESSAHDFIALNVRFENSYNLYITEEELSDLSDGVTPYRNYDLCASNAQTQALALSVKADRAQFYNCEIIGRQDTLLVDGNGNRMYFESCFIEGTVDFIFGNATAVFESCKINAPYHSGHITAASTSEKIPYGYLFNECELSKEITAPVLTNTSKQAPKDDSYSLGRPWNNKAMVSYVNCKMDTHIKDKNDDEGRFVQMGNDGILPKVCRFSEYNTMDINGKAMVMENTCPDYEKVLTDAELQGFYHPYNWLAKRYNASNGNVAADDGWNPGNYPIPN